MLSSLWSVFLLMVALLLVAYIIEMLIKQGFFASIKSDIHYFQLDTLEKITNISKQINQTSDMAEQKTLLVQLKDLAKKYREEQQAIVHPKKSRLEVGSWSYQPWVRFFFLVLTSFVFYGLVFVLFWLFGKNPVDSLKNWLGMTNDPRGFGTVIVALFAAVPALLLWFYRDLNSYKEREANHRDVMFKEHKQLVEWATTEAKLETKASAEAEPATQATTANAPMIQVAGIYQLAPFLKDHHANLYQRSTLETLRAIVNAGRPKWDAWVKAYEEWIETGKTTPEPAKPSLTVAEQAVHAVLRENPILFYHQHFNAKDFNLAGFDGSGLNLVGCDLQGAQLQGSNLTRAQFQGANLYKAQLQGSALGLAQFQCASVSTVNLMGANLINSRLQGADLNSANLQGASVGATKLNGTDLTFANLLDVSLVFGFSEESTVKVEDAVVSEPKLEESDKKRKALQTLIQRDAISIASKSAVSFRDELKTAHSEAVEALAAKGLTATTKESLAESFYPNMDCGLIND